jgi:alcohol dehydrogenase
MSGNTMPVPKNMKAMLLTGHGGPEKLVFDENVPVPTVAPDEILIKVGACGINNTDIWVREGAYGTSDDTDAVASFGDSPIQFPLIQGADIVGTVVETGRHADAALLDTRVMVDFGIYKAPGDDIPSQDYIGAGRPGGFAEYVAVPAENAHIIDSDLTDAELATFCCAYVTGEHMLRRARVSKGDHVLVTGASGGVGSGVIQLCRARGAIPIAVVGPGKEKMVTDIGAESTVTRGLGDLISSVAEVARGHQIDVVVDTVAGPMLPKLIEILRPQGRYVTCGAMGGPIIEIDMRRIYLKNLEIHGASQGTRRDFRTICDFVVSGAIKPLLAATYPLADLARAQLDFKKKNFVGKMVIVVA